MNNPQFTRDPIIGQGKISTLNAGLDGTGTLGTIFTALVDTYVSSITVIATATTVAGMVRIFLTDTAGANPQLEAEVVVTAVTSNQTSPAFTAQVNLGKVLPRGTILKASTSVAQGFNVNAYGGTL